RACTYRQFLRAFIRYRGALVPVGMEGKDEPIVIVDKRRFDFVLHRVWLGVELRAVVGDLDRLALFVRTFEGYFAGFRFPLPFVRRFKQSGNVYAPCVADSFNGVIRIEAICLGYLFDDWIALLRPGICSKHQYPESHKTDDGYTDQILHGEPPR